MPLELITNQPMGTTKLVTVEGDRWKRVVIVVAVEDQIHIEYVDNDPNKMLITVTPGTPAKK